jgi:hypothetical protein
MIKNWLDHQSEEGRIGEFMLCYSVNRDLQDLFEQNKVESAANLPEEAQDAYIFEHAMMLTSLLVCGGAWVLLV